MEKYNIPEQNSLDSMEGVEEQKGHESISNLTSVRCHNTMYSYGKGIDDAMGWAWDNNLKLIPNDDTAAIEKVREISENSNDVVFALVETDEPWKVDLRFENNIYSRHANEPTEIKVKGYKGIAFFRGKEGYGDWESSGSGHQTFFFCKKDNKPETDNAELGVTN